MSNQENNLFQQLEENISSEESNSSNHNPEDINIFLENYENTKLTNKTQPYLTKFERTNVLSKRSQQIMNGAIVFISHPELYKNAYDIAVQELSERKIPFIIKRPYNNSFEYWHTI